MKICQHQEESTGSFIGSLPGSRKRKGLEVGGVLQGMKFFPRKVVCADSDSQSLCRLLENYTAVQAYQMGVEAGGQHKSRGFLCTICRRKEEKQVASISVDLKRKVSHRGL